MAQSNEVQLKGKLQGPRRGAIEFTRFGKD